MSDKRIHKFSAIYLLVYICLPAAIVANVGYGAVIQLPQKTGLIRAAVVFLVCVIWWYVGHKAIHSLGRRALERELDAQGFVRNQTFNSRGGTVIVDVNTGMIALLFTWNPLCSYILPASRISKVWVEDGRRGRDFREGSSKVSFLFTIDRVTVRTYTFTSNKRWKMDSDNILTAISKADMMAEVLENARKLSV